MCGIAGHVSRSADAANVDRMVAAMVHRGPDDQGVWERPGGGAVLGNCRLSIIDLSRAGHMPMSDPSGRVHITYNGELYGFLPLRDELARLGYQFRSHTDTEVILAAWMTWGPACLERLSGMFSFAIHDERDLEHPALFLVRDRLGIKPLYWTPTDGGVAFASEIKVLLASGLVARRADRQAIWDYLTLGSVAWPRTIIEQVQSVPPGHYLSLIDGSLDIRKYWSPPIIQPDPAMSMEMASRRLRELLEEVVAQHMVADVPVGAFLSGGLDSTTLVALASRHTHGPLKTFTVRFGTGPAVADEAAHSALMARQIGSDHVEVEVSAEDVAQRLPEILQAMDQPSVDGVNTWFVSRATRERVTVALSGLGSDEIFAGYPHFKRFARAERLAPNGSRLLRWAGSRTTRLPGRISLGLRFAGSPLADRHLIVREVFSPMAKSSLSADFTGELTATRISRLLDDEDRDPVNSTARAEIGGYLINTLLRDADAMSMAHSLEVRVPFVDHRIVEYALSLRTGLKMSPQGGKAVLREAMAGLLPQELLVRPKSYFSAPLHEWAGGALRPAIDRLLHAEELDPLVDRRALEGLTSRDDPAGSIRAWSLAVLAGWLQTHEVSL